MTEYTLAQLAEEQAHLALNRFNYDVAWDLGSRIRAAAAAKALPVSITVAHGTDVVFSVLMPGATPDNLDWAARKRAVAHRFHRSSLSVRLEAEHAEYDFNARFLLPGTEFIASGGGVPLMLKGGTLIGTAGVSGLPDVEDHKLITTALQQMLGR